MAESWGNVPSGVIEGNLDIARTGSGQFNEETASRIDNKAASMILAQMVMNGTFDNTPTDRAVAVANAGRKNSRDTVLG